jgi:outer membrane biosynthesis protein TonB
MAVSAIFHFLLFIALLSVSSMNGSGARPHANRRVVVISLAPETQTAAPSVPVKPLDQQRLPTPVRKHFAPPRPASSPVRSAPPSPQVPDEVVEEEDVIGRIHDNWLEPPGVSGGFHCRLRIDYAAGGMIAAVRFLQGCGSLALDDSVKRAIWKTQPLPLGSKDKAGTLEFEFTP